MSATAIEWTDEVWNPTVGCTKVSEGCRHCYAKTLHDKRHAAKLAGKDLPAQYARPFEELQVLSDRLGDPIRWKRPRRVFVNSVSDLFHADVPEKFIRDVFCTMCIAQRHTFQVLTKRPERLLQMYGTDQPLSNVWLGVSVEDQRTADERIPLLLQTPAAVRFVSAEPLLGPVNLRFWNPRNPQSEGEWMAAVEGVGVTGRNRPVDWLICGGESGPGARPMHPAWARDLRDQCQAAAVPFFFKQWGEWGWFQGGFAGSTKIEQRFVEGPPFAAWMVRVGKAAAGRELDGRTWDEFPAARAA